MLDAFCIDVPKPPDRISVELVLGDSKVLVPRIFFEAESLRETPPEMGKDSTNNTKFHYKISSVAFTLALVIIVNSKN